MPSSRPAFSRDVIAQSLLTAATVLVLGLVLLRMVVAFSPRIYWDVSPLSGDAITTAELPVTMFGPAGAAWLDVASLAAAALALGAHVLARGRLNWSLATLFLCGASVAGYHAATTPADAWQTLAWISAVALALAAAHLAEHHHLRRFIVAALIAMILPLTIEAVLYVTIQHPQTVAYFQQHEAQTVAEHGWAWESPQHLIYRRRLLTPEVTGAFGLSNVMGSITGALTLLASVLAGATLWRGWRNRWGWALFSLTLLGLLTVVLTRSKGAMLALLLAGSLPLCIAVLRWRFGSRPVKGWWRRVPATLALLLVALAVAAVLLRGAMGPPADATGERSLLFRFHYWQAGIAIVADQPPLSQLLGIGPAAFKPLYSLHKNPLNPEDVTSTHNVMLDLLVMLGLGGLAWCGLMLRHMWKAGIASLPAEQPSPPPPPPAQAPAQASPEIAQQRWVWPAAVLAVLVFAPQYWLQLPTFLAETIVPWMLGVAGFVAIVIGLSRLQVVDEAWVQAALFSAAAMLLIHNQIEMSFFHVSSAVPAWFVLGVAGGAGGWRLRQTVARWHPWLAGGLVVAMLAGSLTLAVGYASPLTAQQEAMRRAVAAVAHHDLPNAMSNLRQAQALMPADPAPVSAQVELLLAQAQWLANEPASPQRDQQLKQVFTQALALLRQARQQGAAPTQLLQTEAQTLAFAAEVLQEPYWRQEALEVWRELVKLQPHSLASRLALAETLWDAGQVDEARQTYQTALKLSDDARLDPLAQLTQAQRQRIAARLR